MERYLEQLLRALPVLSVHISNNILLDMCQVHIQVLNPNEFEKLYCKEVLDCRNALFGVPEGSDPRTYFNVVKQAREEDQGTYSEFKYVFEPKDNSREFGSLQYDSVISSGASNTGTTTQFASGVSFGDMTATQTPVSRGNVNRLRILPVHLQIRIYCHKMMYSMITLC